MTVTAQEYVSWTEKLSAAMYDVDPARTSCKENGCTDEYDFVASVAIDMMVLDGLTLSDAIFVAYNTLFEERLSDDVVRSITNHEIYK